MSRLLQSFFQRDISLVISDLLGKYLVVQSGCSLSSYKITELEMYKGENDEACHAFKGRTTRTEIMYHTGGHLYVYLIYGIHWMLNIVTGKENDPQAILIRGLLELTGPGVITKRLGIDKSFNGENLGNSKRIWIEDRGEKVNFTTHPRIGIDYAGEYWKNIRWRYKVSDYS